MYITVYRSPDGSRINLAGTITGEPVLVEAADTQPVEMGSGLPVFLMDLLFPWGRANLRFMAFC